MTTQISPIPAQELKANIINRYRNLKAQVVKGEVHVDITSTNNCGELIINKNGNKDFYQEGFSKNFLHFIGRYGWTVLEICPDCARLMPEVDQFVGVIADDVIWFDKFNPEERGMTLQEAIAHDVNVCKVLGWPAKVVEDESILGKFYIETDVPM